MLNSEETYKDPKRKVGSQSETPKIEYRDNKILIDGYQKFIIDKKTRVMSVSSNAKKFIFINNLMKILNKKFNCKSMIDIGCNSGLTSLIALNSNFNHIVSLDHDPEYINTLKVIINDCNISEIKPNIYSFGDNISEKFDVVFCGAIIHWIFSLTADFRNFNSIISYLINFTNKYLVIEWVDPEDDAIKILNHINTRRKSEDEEYNKKNFEMSLNKYAKILDTRVCGRSTRQIYIVER